MASADIKRNHRAGESKGEELGNKSLMRLQSRRVTAQFETLLLLTVFLSAAFGQAASRTKPAPSPPSTPRGAMDLLGDLTGRTILYPGDLPTIPLAVIEKMRADTNAAVALLRGELAARGMEIITVGEKFLRVQPIGWSNSSVASFSGRSSVRTNQDIIGIGFVNLTGADLEVMIRAIYSSLDNRNCLRPFTLGTGPRFFFRNQTPLTKEEYVFAMKTVIALNGVTVVNDGERFAQILPPGRGITARTNAPQRNPNATLIPLSKLPSLRPSFGGPPKLPIQLNPPTTTTGKIMARVSAAYGWARIKLLGPPPPPPTPTADGLLSVCAKFAGKKTVASKLYGNQPIVFEIQTPLTKAELLYAIETTLALENLAIIQVDAKTIRLGHISERANAKTENPAKATKP